MKKTFLLLALFLFPPLLASADIRGGEEQIFLQKKKKGVGHHEYYIPADMPEVYYDSDNLEIIIVADGFASYYDVDIVSQSTLLAVISTQIGGYGDSIDVSSLPDGYYTITITSSNNNQFEGTFYKY